MATDRQQETQNRVAELAAELREACEQNMVRVAPGVCGWVPAAGARHGVSRHVLCRWSRQGDGTYIPVPMRYRMVRMTPATTAMLGFISGSSRTRADTLLRLGAAGFVECVRISPKCWLLDLDSWFRHLEECMLDAEYWEPGGEALARYNLANGLGIDHGKK